LVRVAGAHREGHGLRPDDVQTVQARVLLVLPPVAGRELFFNARKRREKSVQSYFAPVVDVMITIFDNFLRKNWFLFIYIYFFWGGGIFFKS
jgi:hypothetical protein